MTPHIAIQCNALDPKEYANSELCISMKEVMLFYSFIQQLLDQNTEVFFTAAQNTYGKMTRFMRRIQNTKSTNLCLEQFLRDYQKILNLWISYLNIFSIGWFSSLFSGIHPGWLLHLHLCLPHRSSPWN